MEIQYSKNSWSNSIIRFSNYYSKESILILGRIIIAIDNKKYNR